MDFVIWLLTGDAHAVAGIFGNMINILINWGIRKALGSLFSGATWVFAPNSEDRGKCRLAEPEWTMMQGAVIEMPSLHAQQVAYYSTFWLIVLAYNMQGNLDSLRKIAALIILELFAFIACYIRYASAYSSLAQIIVGYILGCLWGVGYYYMVSWIVNITNRGTAHF